MNRFVWEGFITVLSLLLLPLVVHAEYITQRDVAFTWLFIVGIGLILAAIYILPVLNLAFLFFGLREIIQLPVSVLDQVRKNKMIGLFLLLHAVIFLMVVLIRHFMQIDIRWGSFFSLWIQLVFFISLRLWKRARTIH